MRIPSASAFQFPAIFLSSSVASSIYIVRCLILCRRRWVLIVAYFGGSESCVGYVSCLVWRSSGHYSEDCSNTCGTARATALSPACSTHEAIPV
ncbi:hypothetical protein H4582DRAFT_1978061 [Lactarius indigo]|nr:hypothetical protein H4582DRAFT_1978061 [Lactarius indigo]